MASGEWKGWWWLELERKTFFLWIFDVFRQKRIRKKIWEPTAETDDLKHHAGIEEAWASGH